MTPLVQITNLEVNRDSRRVLAVDSFIINSGDVIAIIGPNGAGKSSFLLALARLLKTDKGHIFFGDTIDKPLPDLEYRRKLAVVMQEPLLLDASVFDNIAVGLFYRGIDSAQIKVEVEKWAKSFNIHTLLDRSANKISGGESQRVSLARAFVLAPELLLLDEPFSSLDPQTRKTIILDLKKVIAETKTTTLFITHDLDDSLVLADRIAVVWDGKVIQTGSKQEVLTHPVNDELRLYLGSFYKSAS
jgi:tungstate transport system ATP-binding protein